MGEKTLTDTMLDSKLDKEYIGQVRNIVFGRMITGITTYFILGKAVEMMKNTGEADFKELSNAYGINIEQSKLSVNLGKIKNHIFIPQKSMFNEENRKATLFEGDLRNSMDGLMYAKSKKMLEGIDDKDWSLHNTTKMINYKWDEEDFDSPQFKNPGIIHRGHIFGKDLYFICRNEYLDNPNLYNRDHGIVTMIKKYDKEVFNLQKSRFYK